MFTAALILTLAPLAAPDAVVHTKSKSRSTTTATTSAPVAAERSATAARSATEVRRAKKRRAKRLRAKKKELAEVLALEPPVTKTIAAPDIKTTTTRAAARIGDTRSTQPPLPIAPSLSVPQTGLSLANLFWPGLLLCAGAAVLLFLKRKNHHARSLAVIESVAVGRGRDLVVVDIAGSRILLGCTDGGISVLEKGLPRSTSSHLPTSSRTTGAAKEGSVAAALSQAFKQSLSRFTGRQSSTTAAFEQHLESTEGAACTEQEVLARKLKAHMEQASTTERTDPGFNLSARVKAVRA